MEHQSSLILVSMAIAALFALLVAPLVERLVAWWEGR